MIVSRFSELIQRNWSIRYCEYKGDDPYWEGDISANPRSIRNSPHLSLTRAIQWVNREHFYVLFEYTLYHFLVQKFKNGFSHVENKVLGYWNHTYPGIFIFLNIGL
ncbi:hypothetical protein COM18_11665 [Bacillus pseudomycoides]|nr:hypothetical protein COM18_11665 [Bacillus pseudomycoides]